MVLGQETDFAMTSFGGIAPILIAHDDRRALVFYFSIVGTWFVKISDICRSQYGYIRGAKST